MRRLGEAFQRAGRRHGLAAFQPGDDGLRRSHGLGYLFLRHRRIAARLDQRRGDSEFVFERIIDGDEFRVLPPFPGGFLDGYVSRLIERPSPFSMAPFHETAQHDVHPALPAASAHGGDFLRRVAHDIFFSRHHATVVNPLRATRDSSLSDAPCGRFSPRSHWLTRPVVTFR